MCVKTFLYTFFSCFFFCIFWNYKKSQENKNLKKECALLFKKIQELESDTHKKQTVGEFLVKLLDGVGTGNAQAVLSSRNESTQEAGNE
jgi:hypothetical protein